MKLLHIDVVDLRLMPGKTRRYIIDVSSRHSITMCETSMIIMSVKCV